MEARTVACVLLTMSVVTILLTTINMAYGTTAKGVGGLEEGGGGGFGQVEVLEWLTSTSSTASTENGTKHYSVILISTVKYRKRTNEYLYEYYVFNSADGGTGDNPIIRFKIDKDPASSVYNARVPNHWIFDDGANADGTYFEFLVHTNFLESAIKKGHAASFSVWSKDDYAHFDIKATYLDEFDLNGPNGALAPSSESGSGSGMKTNVLPTFPSDDRTLELSSYFGLAATIMVATAATASHFKRKNFS